MSLIGSHCPINVSEMGATIIAITIVRPRPILLTDGPPILLLSTPVMIHKMATGNVNIKPKNTENMIYLM